MWVDAAINHAQDCWPREACGLVVLVRGRLRYWPCRNIATTPDEHFVVNPADYAAAEDAGTVSAVVHSHPNATPEPSEADLVACEASGLPWHVVSVPGYVWRSIVPTGFRAPLLGREFRWGVQDCYALIRDWYAQERGVLLPDFPRRAGDFEAGRDLYTEGFPKAGFRAVSGPPQPGDVLLFRLAARVPDHGAIYEAGDRIVHHLQGRLSSRDPWDGFMRERTVGVLRYADGQAVR